MVVHLISKNLATLKNVSQLTVLSSLYFKLLVSYSSYFEKFSYFEKCVNLQYWVVCILYCWSFVHLISTNLATLKNVSQLTVLSSLYFKLLVSYSSYFEKFSYFEKMSQLTVLSSLYFKLLVICSSYFDKFNYFEKCVATYSSE